MLMMCWFYCIPLAKGMFYASALLLFVFALFMLKRGVRQSRKELRQYAFLMMFVAALKLFIVDVYMLREDLLCGDWFQSACTPTGFKLLQAAGLAAATLSCAGLLHAYRSFVFNRKQKELMPAQVRLPFWANLSISFVVLLILWQMAPWVGYLTIGHVPQFIMNVPWQHLAVLNIVILLVGFWKLEDCNWIYNPADKKKKEHLQRVWTPKDTLWLSVILLLITLAFSYASNDVLTSSLPRKGAHFQFDKINLDGIENGFKMPQGE